MFLLIEKIIELLGSANIQINDEVLIDSIKCNLDKLEKRILALFQ